MSRKSVRLQSKSNERQTPAILNRKRKSQREQEEIDQDDTNAKSNSRIRMEDGFLMTPKSSVVTDLTWSRFRSLSTLPISPSTKLSPLPNLTWADPQDVWDFMMKKEMKYKRDSTFLKRHPALQANMRAILLDWLIEVCEVYKLHRDTYYLSLDFVDRFLATQSNIPKQQLQLIGITALFLAAKIEEIYPPKLSEFSYVTDGACSEDDILIKELIILKALKWDLSPVTVYGWINTFLQISNLKNISDSAKNFVYPQYSVYVLVQISKLVDLCMLDVGSLNFSYSIIAASALYHTTSKELMFRVSGYNWIDVYACVQWMAPFAETVKENGPVQPRIFEQVTKDDMHNIQTHDVDLNLLESAQSRRRSQSSYDNSEEFLTPPKSHEKGALLPHKSSRKDDDEDDDDDDEEEDDDVVYVHNNKYNFVLV